MLPLGSFLSVIALISASSRQRSARRNRRGVVDGDGFGGFFVRRSVIIEDSFKSFVVERTA
jgi:hypothetical protein